MSVPYLERHRPARRQFRARTRKPTGCIVVHTAESPADTQGPDSGAENVAAFIARRSDPGSYHRLADSDSQLELIGFDYAAYGDGTGSNEFAIHISVAIQAAQWPKMSRRWRDNALQHLAEAAVDAIVWLRETYGIKVPAKRISRAESERGLPGFISHAERDPSRRSDPGAGFPWEQFLELVADLLAQRTKPAKPASASPRWDLLVDVAKDIYADLPKDAERRRVVLRQVVALASPFSEKHEHASDPRPKR